jgi:hypothetical protein
MYLPLSPRTSFFGSFMLAALGIVLFVAVLTYMVVGILEG